MSPTTRPNSAHANNIVQAAFSVGYTLEDFLPAFPGVSVDYVDSLAKDNAGALERPVLPYGLLGILPRQSKYFNVSKAGLRTHDIKQPWPIDPKRINIGCFGGSTMLGALAEDSQTIPAELHRLLKSRGYQVEVYNFSAGNYTARHDALRFLDLLDHGATLDIALFLDGFNDSQYALGNYDLVQALNYLYLSEKRRRRMSFPFAVADYGYERISGAADLPVARSYLPQSDLIPACRYWLGEAGIREALDNSSRTYSDSELSEAHNLIGPLVWNNYLRSRRIVQASAHPKTSLFFFWQPVPLHAAGAQHRILERLYPLFPTSVFSALSYKWLHAKKFPGIEQGHFSDLSASLPQAEQVLYVDNCHYTAGFMKHLAEKISVEIEPCVKDLIHNRSKEPS